MCVSGTVLCLMSPLRPKAVGLSDRWTGLVALARSLYLSTFGTDALLTLVLVHILVRVTLVLIPCYVYCPALLFTHLLYFMGNTLLP